MNIGETKILAILGLLMVITATIFDMPILFGILYLTWAIQDLQSGYAFILEDVSRDANPILYYITCSIWLLGGLYVLAEPLIIKLMYLFYYL
ncbi:hypothetical protein EZV73_05875 [Acidaminobacter sp. JC074]|uniref:hypothetical protein n=1 Tax=Acidaminobacter sp. JC074 TaxID=2530199 RepID=UPI001F0FBE60|nr:hypothetical protein [Acidaminobacter sp. JC074]MCH4887087.1 hypothetical protein [Acidaminobacter sp. JC074]